MAPGTAKGGSSTLQAAFNAAVSTLPGETAATSTLRFLVSGPTKFPSRVVLKRGITDDKVLWSWHQDVTRGRVTRKDVSILLLDSTGVEKRRWSFREAAPVKWVGPQFRAASSEVAIESLELVHKGLAQG